MNHNHLELNHNCDEKKEEKTPEVVDAHVVEYEKVELEGFEVPSRDGLEYLKQNHPEEYDYWVNRISELEELKNERIRKQEILDRELEESRKLAEGNEYGNKEKYGGYEYGWQEVHNK